MRARACVAVAIGLLLTGCAGPTAVPTATLGPTQSPSQTPTLAPSPTRVGGARIQLVGTSPVLRASALGDGHYGYIMPAAYFAVGEMRHAYFVGFAEARGDQHVYHATSSDGVEWTIDPADPFANLGVDLSPPGPIPTSVIEIDGVWVMYLWGVPAPGFDQSAIWRATSTDPAGPWTADTDPVLRPGASGAWDDRGLDFPAVALTQDRYVMFYSASGGPQPNIAHIGRATSDDGIHWMRDPEPVAENGVCSYDVRYVAQPRILSSTGEFIVLYDTDRRVSAAAAGQDGTHWRCLTDQPLLSGDDIPGGQGIHTEAVTHTTGGYSVLLESLIDGASELWLGEVVGLE